MLALVSMVPPPPSEPLTGWLAIASVSVSPLTSLHVSGTAIEVWNGTSTDFVSHVGAKSRWKSMTPPLPESAAYTLSPSLETATPSGMLIVESVWQAPALPEDESSRASPRVG